MNFRKMSHTGATLDEGEILFSTRFDYFFPEAARSPLCLLPAAPETVEGLRALGRLMADPGDPGNPMENLDSRIPAAFTYLGQFIDHDITARTDRNGRVSTIGANVVISPQDPDIIVRDLRNGRRPELDLDSVFGDGPGLSGSQLRTTTQSSDLYSDSLQLNCFDKAGRVDVPRKNHVALIADARNDENVIVGQIQTAFLKFYNAVLARQSGDREERYVRARQLVRWTYQFIVVNEYLRTVCDEGIVLDTLANGPRALGSSAGRGDSFMPLEFSVAAFRFGHSMIRPFYVLNERSGPVLIRDLLGTSGNPDNFDPTDGQLKTERIVDWRNFIGDGPNVLRARRLDTKIARGLFDLPMEDRRGDPILAHLAQSNLLRGYSLSIPTAQAMADGFGVVPLTPKQLVDGEAPEIASLLLDTGFDRRTPLWYYVLREAAVQQDGQRLGELGSRILCETLIGLLKQDRNSVLNNAHDRAVEDRAVDVIFGLGGRIENFQDLLEFAGVVDFHRGHTR